MNDLLLRALRREPTERTPIWIMRQAGRYLPEYREVRSKVDFVTLCKTPELATEVTLQPIRRYGLDAAILFSDILVPVEPMGFGIEFNPGPVIDKPVRSAADVERVRVPEPEQELPYVYEAIRMLRRELEGKVPLIGFAASPFTLAVYMVEGQGSKNFDKIKGMLFDAPEALHALLEKISETTIRYVGAQIDAGAQAFQLFDTWAGILAPETYREFALRYARRVLDALADRGVPRVNSAHLWEEIRECSADALGVDWRTGLDKAHGILGDRFALQGNLDPCVLLASPDTVEREARKVLERARKLPGHVFNLGHGILPPTPTENVQRLVETVQGYRGERGLVRRRAGGFFGQLLPQSQLPPRKNLAQPLTDRPVGLYVLSRDG